MPSAREHLEKMRQLSNQVVLVLDGFESGVADKDIPSEVREEIEESSRHLEAAHQRMLNQVYGYDRTSQPHRS